jgi:tRNA U34 2-thiouridine synthase MnmA/TrmU
VTTHRALALLSGGLDSALAARLMLDQGVEVTGLHLESPTACRSDVREVARALGIPLELRAKGEEYLRLLRHPRWGYGKNMNPCIDCRVFMFRVARESMDRLGARFLVTGEVAGQRPMSQSKNTLALIDREADLEGWVLRPLSAWLLPETEPERRGWVDRSRLLAISGRGRTEQLELASRLGLSHYQSPGGGCLLTDAHFSAKLRDLLDHASEDRADMSDVALLRLGRHFRVRPDLKVVLGRNAEENRRLHEFQSAERWLVEPHGFNGPTALVCGPRDEEGLGAARRLMAEYTRDARADLEVRWQERGATRTLPLLSIVPASPCPAPELAGPS